MRSSGRPRGGRVARLLGAATLFAGPALASAPAAVAQESLIAIVEGNAVASAAYLPAMVNPNLDLWPAFTQSSIDSESSHGVAAGFWPGAIGDAFVEFYSFGKEARTFFGVAESLWPGDPHSDDAAASDFGALCEAGRRDFLMPTPIPTASFPDLLLDTCQLFWGEFGSQYPLHYAEGRTDSRSLGSLGTADLVRTIEFPLVQDQTLAVGTGHSASTTSVQRVGARSAVVSEALSVLGDVRIGESLRIEKVTFMARATSDGTMSGVKTERSVRIVGATMNGKPVDIDSAGVRAVQTVNGNAQYRSLNATLAAQGLQVRLVPGTEAVFEDGAKTEASSGVLAVEVIRPPIRDVVAGSDPKPPRAVADALQPLLDPTCVAFDELYPDPVIDPPPEIELGPNPLYRPEPGAFPWNQLPPSLDQVGAVPPPLPVCVPAELNRNVHIGVALGRADASARIVPLPPLPPPPPDIPEILPRTIVDTTFIPGSGGPALPGDGGGPLLGANGARGRRGGELSADVAGRVEALYLGMVLLMLALAGGRSAFRNLVRT